jgi:hypothetical protein
MVTEQVARHDQGARFEGERRNPFTETALTLIGAGAAGIGVLGLVAGVGGAIMYARFSQAGLPAEQAVAVQPRGVLVAVGAETLIPMAGTVLVALTIYAILSWLVRKRIGAWTIGHLRILRPDGAIAVIWALGAACAAIFYYAESANRVPYHSVLAVTGVAVGASLIWVMVTDLGIPLAIRFVVLAVLTAVVAGWIGWIRTEDNPTLRSAAVLFDRSSGARTTTLRVSEGLFVAETNDRIYLAKPGLADGSFLVFDLRDVAAVAFSSNEPVSIALKNETALAYALRHSAG